MKLSKNRLLITKIAVALSVLYAIFACIQGQFLISELLGNIILYPIATIVVVLTIFYSIDKKAKRKQNSSNFSDETSRYSDIDSLFPQQINDYKLYKVYQMNISGTQHCNMRAARKLKRGNELILKPFPSEFDSKGVKVLTTKNEHIGWIPADSTYKNTIFNGLNKDCPFPARFYDANEYDENIYIKISVGWYEKQ